MLNSTTVLAGLAPLGMYFLVGVLIAFILPRVGIHPSVALVALAFDALVLKSGSALLDPLAACAGVAIGDHFHKQKYFRLTTTTQLACMLVLSGRRCLLERSRQELVAVLLAAGAVSEGLLHTVFGISVPLLVLLSAQLPCVWYASAHLHDERFDEDGDLHTPEGLLTKLVGVCRTLDPLIRNGWCEQRRIMLAFSILGVYLLDRITGIGLIQVVIWAELLSVTWLAAQDRCNR